MQTLNPQLLPTVTTSSSGVTAGKKLPSQALASAVERREFQENLQRATREQLHRMRAAERDDDRLKTKPITAREADYQRHVAQQNSEKNTQKIAGDEDSYHQKTPDTVERANGAPPAETDPAGMKDRPGEQTTTAVSPEDNVLSEFEPGAENVLIDASVLPGPLLTDPGATNISGNTAIAGLTEEATAEELLGNVVASVTDSASQTRVASDELPLPAPFNLFNQGLPVGSNKQDTSESADEGAEDGNPAATDLLNLLQKIVVNTDSSSNTVPASPVNNPVDKVFVLPADMAALKKDVLPNDVASLLNPAKMGGASDGDLDQLVSPTSEKPATNTSASAPGASQFNTALEAAGLTVSARPTVTSEKVTLPMSVVFGHTQWTQELGERTGWLVNHKIEEADIQLDPPELGPIAVRIHMQNDQASISFSTANPAVKEALEQSMARLKEMLQEQGIALNHSDVSSQHQSAHSDDPELAAVPGILVDEGSGDAVAINVTTKSPYQIDYFA